MYKVNINCIENGKHLLYTDVECDDLNEVNRVVTTCWQYHEDITDVHVVHIDRYQERTGRQP